VGQLTLPLVRWARANVFGLRAFARDRWKMAMAYNANVCDRAGTLKPRPVPYTKLYKDMKTMENNSPPTGANIMLWVRAAKPP
jgi:hypothetical protein